MAFVISLVALFLELLFMEEGKISPAMRSFTYSVLGLTNIKLFISGLEYFKLDLNFSFFTHTWSLGVEEQFYFFYSVSMFVSLLIFRRKKSSFSKIHFSLIFSAFIISIFLLLYLLALGKGSLFSFYMFPSRLFQLASGVLLYYFIYELKQTKTKAFFERYSKKILIISYFVLLFFLFFPYMPSVFPFPLAVFITLPVLFICYFSTLESSELKSPLRWLKTPFLVWTGRISYSLYLVHWLVVVFIRHTFGVSFLFSILGVVLSFFLSSLTYKFLEKPSKEYLSKKRLRAYLFLFVVILSSLVRYTPFSKNKISFYNFMKVDLKSWHEELLCDGAGDVKAFKDPLVSCLARQEEKNTLFLNGDSHAAQLTFGLEKAIRGWGDLRYINFDSKNDSHGFTKNKLKIFETKPSVFEFLENEVRKGDVVALTFASSRISRFTENQLRISFQYWDDFIKVMLSKGVSVLLLLDSPSFNRMSVNRCIFRLKFFDDKSSCIKKVSYVEQNRRKQSYWFNLFSQRYENVFIYDVAKNFCDNKHCSMLKNNELLFIDFHHISKKASLALSDSLRAFLKSNKMINF